MAVAALLLRSLHDATVRSRALCTLRQLVNCCERRYCFAWTALLWLTQRKRAIKLRTSRAAPPSSQTAAGGRMIPSVGRTGPASSKRRGKGVAGAGWPATVGVGIAVAVAVADGVGVIVGVAVLVGGAVGGGRRGGRGARGRAGTRVGRGWLRVRVAVGRSLIGDGVAVGAGVGGAVVAVAGGG